MANQEFQSTSPNTGANQSKRRLEDHEDSHSPKRLKTSHGQALTEDNSVNEGSSKNDRVSDDTESITSSNHRSTPSPEHGLDVHHILPSIEEDPVPTTPERHTSSPKETLESSDEEDIDHLPSGIPSSSPSPATSPSPSAPQPRNASSATASPMRRPSSRSLEDFSPSPNSPFSSYTSISEGDSDEGDSDEGDSEDEDWDDTMFNMWNNPPWQVLGPDEDVLGMVLDWQAPAPAVQDWPEPTFVGDSNYHDGDGYDSEEDDETEAESDSDSDNESSLDTPSQQSVPNLFASRYASWPDFDAPVDAPGGQVTDIYDDSDAELPFEGVRYPGMNIFALEGYTSAAEHWSEPGDQEHEGTFMDDDSDDDCDDYDDSKWAFERESSLEAQCRVQ